MVKIGLQIKATLENVEELTTNHPNYNFLLKFKCLNCGEVSEKWHDIMESQTFPTKTGKSETNYLAKCKLCARENSMDIVEKSNGEKNDFNCFCYNFGIFSILFFIGFLYFMVFKSLE